MEILIRSNSGAFFNETLLEHINSKNDAKIWSILGDANPCELSDSTGTTLLHYAARYGNEQFTNQLIALGTNVDVLNHNNNTPLMYALKANQKETVCLLLDNDADILIPDVNGQCVLGKVLNKRSKLVSADIATAVLNKVTAKSLKDSEYVASNEFHRDCLLYHFMVLNDIEVFQTLIEKGSSIDARNPRTGETTLHRALSELRAEHVKLLLEHGADINAKTFTGRLPIQCISNFKDKTKLLATLKELINAGVALVELFPLVKSLLLNGTRDIVRLVLQCGLDLQIRDTYEMTPLHYLAKNPHPDIFEELRGRNFDVDVSCGELCTPLHYAAHKGNVSSIKFLLDRGANVNARDELNCSPLCKAIDLMRLYSKLSNKTLQKYADCIVLLLERGADYPEMAERDCDCREILLHDSDDRQSMKLFDLVLAHLASIAVSGRALNQSMYNMIHSSSKFERHFDSFEGQLEILKARNVDESITLYDFLFATDEEISHYPRYKTLIPDSKKIMKNCFINSSYRSKLEKRFLKVTKLMELRAEIAKVLNEIFKELWNISIYNVTVMIVSMLDDQDLYQMS